MGRCRWVGLTAVVVVATSGCAWVGRVGVSSAGQQPSGGFISGSDISPNGRYVVFTSDATNLVPNDTNGAADVFWRDNQTGVTERVSVRNAGTQAAFGGYSGLVSADGRYVAFNSDSSDLIATGDTNDSTDVFLRDRVGGTTIRVSVRSGGLQSDDSSYLTSMTPDAKVFTFESDATNLIGTADENYSTDIYIRDLNTSKTERMSVATDGEEGDIDSYGGSISDNGRYVTFLSDASNFDFNDSGIFTDVFVRDRTAVTTTRITGFPDGDEADSDATAALMSGDGTTVVFDTDATNLIVGVDPPFSTNVYTATLGTPGYELVSRNPAGQAGDDFSFVTGISDNARFVLFQSASTDLVNQTLLAGSDAFVRDRTRGVTTLAGLTQKQGEPSNPDPSLAGSIPHGISGDGRYVMYSSSATDVMGEVDTNGTVSDLFLQSNPVPFFFAASPSSIARGTTVTVTLTGNGLHAGSLVLLGDGITINSVTVPNESTMNVNLTVAAGAAPGKRTPVVVDPGTGAGGATGGIAFIPDLITIT